MCRSARERDWHPRRSASNDNVTLPRPEPERPTKRLVYRAFVSRWNRRRAQIDVGAVGEQVRSVRGRQSALPRQ